MRVIEGRAFLDRGLVDCAIGIEDGRVVKIAKVLRGDERLRYPGAIILPGMVDAHVHMRDPGWPEKEDFRSGTEAAACGGVTTVAEMPNTKPVADSPERVEQKLDSIRGRANVDFAVLGGLREGADVAGMARDCAGFKLYMAPSTAEMHVKDYSGLPGLFAAAAEAGRPVSVHCEHEDYLRGGAAASLEDHGRRRPPEAEAAGIDLLREAKGSAAVHVAHVSSETSLPRIGGGLTCEVTPHHLLLTEGDELGALGKVNPPLRQKSDSAALWRALNAGTIQVIASDHAPHTLEEKGAFETAPSGMPGVETLFPLMMARVRAGNLTLQRLVDAMAVRPAEILGLAKGRIAEGLEADLLAVDPREERRIRGDVLHSRCGWTAFEGHTGVFPRAVFLRGELIAEDTELQDEGQGRLLSPQ